MVSVQIYSQVLSIFSPPSNDAVVALQIALPHSASSLAPLKKTITYPILLTDDDV